MTPNELYAFPPFFKLCRCYFWGGSIVSIFGGAEVNLVESKIKKSPAVIDIFTSFGGTTIVVPQDWSIHLEVVSIFGGFADKRTSTVATTGEDKKVLVVKGFTIFGGGVILSA